MTCTFTASPGDWAELWTVGMSDRSKHLEFQSCDDGDDDDLD